MRYTISLAGGQKRGESQSSNRHSAKLVAFASCRILGNDDSHHSAGGDDTQGAGLEKPYIVIRNRPLRGRVYWR